MGVIGVAVAGLGGLGEALVRDLGAAGQLRLVAVQDVDAGRAETIGRRYGAPWIGTDYAAMLRAPGVDAVAICTPNVLHVPQAREALAAGKDALVQKPLALDPADARDLVERAGAGGRVLFVDYSYRYLETTRALRGALASLGRVRRAQAVFHNVFGPAGGWFFDPRSSGGGALIDLGVHLLDLALDLLAPAAVVLDEVALARRPEQAVEHAARLGLRLDGVPLEVEVSWGADRSQSEIAFRVEGERGDVAWENVAGSFFRFRTRQGADTVVERETTLRADTLRAFATALEARRAPPVDVRVYDLLAEAYRRASLAPSHPDGPTSRTG